MAHGWTYYRALHDSGKIPHSIWIAALILGAVAIWLSIRAWLYPGIRCLGTRFAIQGVAILMMVSGVTLLLRNARAEGSQILLGYMLNIIGMAIIGLGGVLRSRPAVEN